MTKALPRVTYSNIAADFGALHDWLDQALPRFRKASIGQAWPNVVAGRHDVSGRAYEVHCPFDHDLIVARLVAGDRKAVKSAVAAAREAFPDWSGMDWKARLKIMRKWAKEIDRRKYDLGMAALYEVGKSRLEAIGEAEEAVDLIEWYCDEMERNKGFVRPMARALKAEETSCQLKPVGVFAVIAPFNFPVALACNMLGACLVAGNTAVFKPSPQSGLTAALLMETAEAAGLPPGVVNMINGEEAGPLLVDCDGVDGVAFTGSHQVGMRIFRKFASGPFARPVICEMGGKNPAYVSARADLERAAEGLVRSAFGLSGEKCSACSVAYVETAVVGDLLKRLKVLAEAIVTGNPEDRRTFMGPVINEAAIERFHKAVKAARSKGRIVHGGDRLAGGSYAKGHFVAPTIVAELPPDHWINKEELFLPFLSVQACASLDEGIQLGNRNVYGLCAGLYSEDPREIERFLAIAQAGVLYVNRRSGATTGAWPGVQSFCGWKGSGVDGKGGLGPFTIPRYMREQSLTIMRG
ncbi:aldehyde dehydrogenase family protein [Taklimakanibacter lacteus]|uniref:aldehyde dehydrogenase family protein n=1 Tax=Taklimakanibacter lacteus TaxID=2268456 RepID=UPI000E671B10